MSFSRIINYKFNYQSGTDYQTSSNDHQTNVYIIVMIIYAIRKTEFYKKGANYAYFFLSYY